MRDDFSEQLRKSKSRSRRKALLLLLPVVFIAIVLMVSSYPESSTEQFHAKQATLSKDQLEFIHKLELDGDIRIEHELNRAYISTPLWLRMDAKLKEDFSAVLAVYCGSRKGTGTNWVEIFDKQSGKKLAKYGAWGFTVY